jgi:predicted nucleotidyltransferase
MRMGTDDVSEMLVTLAQRLSVVYVAHCAPRAVLLTGSTAEGLADEYSDLDVIAY